GLSGWQEDRCAGPSQFQRGSAAAAQEGGRGRFRRLGVCQLPRADGSRPRARQPDPFRCARAPAQQAGHGRTQGRRRDGDCACRRACPRSGKRRIQEYPGEVEPQRRRHPARAITRKHMHEPQALISCEELAAALGNANLRIYDCTTYLEPTPAGSDDPYIAVPGRKTFEEAHIPGAGFLALQGEFSDATTRLRFMMPPMAQLEEAFARHGFSRGSRVVLYSIGTMMWATRFWWMLKSLGFDNAAVLNGGFDAWKAQARPTESGPARGYPPRDFQAAPRPRFFVDKSAVLAATQARDTPNVHPLRPQLHQRPEP